MAADKNFLRITVERLNEGLHQDSTVTVEAVGVEVDAKGSLSITSVDGGRSFSWSTWDSFTVSRVGKA